MRNRAKFVSIFVIFLAIPVIFSIIYYSIYLRYQRIYDDSHIISLINSSSFDLRLDKKIHILPSFCLPDKIFYRAFGCGDALEEARDILSHGYASKVLAYPVDGSGAKKTLKEMSRRAFFQLSDKGELEISPVDTPDFNSKIKMSFDCNLFLLRNDNVLYLKVYFNVCGYDSQFVYAVVAIRNIYGFPPNPVGEALLPIRVVDWRDLEGQKNDKQ